MAVETASRENQKSLFAIFLSPIRQFPLTRPQTLVWIVQMITALVLTLVGAYLTVESPWLVIPSFLLFLCWNLIDGIARLFTASESGQGESDRHCRAVWGLISAGLLIILTIMMVKTPKECTLSFALLMGFSVLLFVIPSILSVFSLQFREAIIDVAEHVSEENENIDRKIDQAHAAEPKTGLKL